MTALEFIHKHREDEDNCECLILPNGNVEEPLPSHIGRLVEIAGYDQAILHGKMERSMEPLFWMVEFTGCVSVWQTRVVVPSGMTRQQRDALEQLHDAAFLSPRYLLEQVDEKYAESVRAAKEKINIR